jgi:DNA repair protein RadD
VSGEAPTLRPYQTAAIASLEAAFAAGKRAPILGAPTGSGKTVIAGAIIQRAAAEGQSVLFLAPRRELVHQASRKLDDVGVPHGIILAGDDRHNIYSRVQIGSIDTLRSRANRLQLNPDLVIADECHVYVTAIRKRLLEQWPNARRIGLTATPARKDGRGLNNLFDDLIEVASVAELTEQRYLVPARYFSIAEPDLSRVSTIAGDYKVGEAETAMAPLLGDIVQTWLQRAGGRRTAVFCMSVAHSVSLRALFAGAGVRAEHVDGTTPLDQREAIFERFAAGKTQVLCNVLVASIGFDLPTLDCIVLARPTRSLVMYLQMLGRGLRPAPGKSDCLVLDHSGCVHRLGFAADERYWTLDGHADLESTRSRREAAAGKEVTCPECSCVYCGGRTCPECGHYIAPRGKEIMTIDGELVEVGGHLDEDGQTRLLFFVELLGYATERGYKPGWAAYKFKEKHGAFPPRAWSHSPAATPSTQTRNWIKSRLIAYRKALAASA